MITKEDLKDYDWEQAFNYADFSVEDIITIIAAEEGEHDGNSWILVAELNDGKFGYLDAGCCYTGWDCQSSGSSYIGTFEHIQRWCMTSSSRRRLGLTLEDLDNYK